jgi:predicted DsbA family dithiol-disulfide isomerase
VVPGPTATGSTGPVADVAPGTIAIYSDLGCPWAHLAVARLHRARREAGLDDAVRFDHRSFPLEVVNRQPTPKKVFEAEVPVVGALEPEAGWQVWQGPESAFPVTTLPALEAVQAAKAQGLAASERLDRGLRIAFYGQSRCISLRHVILEVAGECGVDGDALADALDRGSARGEVFRHLARAEEDGARGSPHVFLPDGGEAHNPGVTMHWQGGHGEGFPVIDADDPAAHARLVRRAARDVA